MNGLIWKAWREQRQGFAAMTVIYIVGAWLFTPYPMYAPSHNIVELVLGMTMLYSIIASIAFAMGTACGERETGSLWYTVSLPVSTRRYAAIRLLMGLTMLLLPIGILAIYALIILSIHWSPVAIDPIRQKTEPLSEVQMRLAVVTAIGMLGTSAFYLPLCLIGCWLRTKTKVLMMGAVLTLGLLVSLASMGSLGTGMRGGLFAPIVVVFPQSMAQYFFFGILWPTSPYVLLWLAATLAWQVTLAGLFINYYGREPEPMSELRSRWWLLSVPPLLSKVGVPFRGPRSAMLWLELRQAGPLVLFGMILVLMLAASFALVAFTNSPAEGWLASLRRFLPNAILIFALVWAAAIGTSLFVADFNRRLGAFWRSRPISPNGWFWCKYIVGLTAMLIVMDGTVLAMGWSLASDLSGRPTERQWAPFACYPLLHALIYTLAVVGVCGTRRATGGIIGGLIFWGCLLWINLLPSLYPYSPLYIVEILIDAERQGQLDLTQHHYPLVYGIIALAIVVLAFAASRLAAPLEPTGGRLWLKPARG